MEVEFQWSRWNVDNNLSPSKGTSCITLTMYIPYFLLAWSSMKLGWPSSNWGNCKPALAAARRLSSRGDKIRSAPVSNSCRRFLSFRSVNNCAYVSLSFWSVGDPGDRYCSTTNARVGWEESPPTSGTFVLRFRRIRRIIVFGTFDGFMFEISGSERSNRRLNGRNMNAAVVEMTKQLE